MYLYMKCVFMGFSSQLRAAFFQWDSSFGFPGYICLFCQSYHWSFSQLPFINTGSILRPVCSFKLRKLTLGYVFEEKLEENAGDVLVKILRMQDSHEGLSL